jgi:hypothetical protein
LARHLVTEPIIIIGTIFEKRKHLDLIKRDAQILIKTKLNYLQNIIKGPASFELGSDRKCLCIAFNQIKMF